MRAEDLIVVSGMTAIIMLLIAMLATTLRIILGPTLADRVLALDMLVAIAIGFIALIAIQTGHVLYIDIALALGLVGFLATIALARFIETTAPPTPLAWPQMPGKRKATIVKSRSKSRKKGGKIP